MLHHWCGSCVQRGDLLREAITWLGKDAWMQRSSFGDTPLHSLCANPEIDLTVMQALGDMIPPHAWRARGREGSPLHALCNNCAVSGSILRAMSECWHDDDYIALLQANILGLTPVELLWQTCHDVGSSTARPLPPVGQHSLYRNLDYAEYHGDGMDALYVAAQMAARAAAVPEPVHNAARQEILQHIVRCTFHRSRVAIRIQLTDL